MDVAQTAALRLKGLRTSCGMSQQAVADAIGVDRSSYCYYEKGDRLPASERLIMLSELFGASVDYILGLSDEPAPRVTTPEQKAEIETMIAGQESMTDEELIARLPVELRDGVQALIRAELQKQG